MNLDELDYYELEELHNLGPGDDPAVQQLEPELIALFEANPEQVYYENQLSVLFESRFFHWVTARALKDLRESGKIGSEIQELQGRTQLRFYFHRRNRYWRRRASEIRRLVLLFSNQAFTNALGVQGELLIDGGLPRVGFQPKDYNVRSWNGAAWLKSGHDLDRVFSRDGIDYGAEIKNRLSYISQEELITKLAMCSELHLKPLFIARMMPKTYIQLVNKAGGFCLIMKYQFYPVSHKDLAAQVRQELQLPVDAPARLQDSTLLRFLKWHEINLSK